MSPVSIQKFVRSFRHALAGIAYAIREERNFHIELAIAIGVAFFAWYFPLSSDERAILTLVIVLVLALELVNTSFERMLDMTKPRIHPYVRVIKDLVAGSVLISAIGAAIIGALIFLPHIV
ncbi:MAG: diacylglycerol kinase family protein [Candidatus Moraniibacteriota bacterium]|nr:MAG: diacylglycerol kinase family protein [Candidatus Moranbacteria bacterium]